MNPLDYLIITLLTVLFIKGLINGLIKELFSLAAFILGAVVAYYFSDNISSLLCGFWPQSCQFNYLIFLLLFLITAVTVSYLGTLLTKAAKFIALGGINRLFGGFFGILKGLIVLFLFLIVFEEITEIVDLPTVTIIDNSLILSWFRNTLDIDISLLKDALNAR